jgi:hypothetical protein
MNQNQIPKNKSVFSLLHLDNFNNLFAKKFPLNIFVGSEINLKNKNLKVYHGKYIRTFIVNSSMKQNIKKRVDTNNPYEEDIKGNCVYFEEKPKIFSQKNKNSSSSKKNSSKKHLNLPKLDIPSLRKDEQKLDTQSKDKDEKLLLIKRIYGLKHFKDSNSDRGKLGKSNVSQRKQEVSSFRSASRNNNESYRTCQNKQKSPTVNSFFKNEEFYYFNTNI